MSLGSYLRNARERRGLTLDQAAQHVRIAAALLSDLENNDLKRWPKARIYRHGYLRGYADVLGLDSAAVLARFDDEFGDLYPVAFHEKRPPAAKPVPFGTLSKVVLATSIMVMIGGIARILQSDPGGLADDVPSIGSQVFSAGQPDWSPAPIDSLSSVGPVSAQTEGELRILSNPPSAHVTVNGIGRGATPLRVRYLPPGPYTIRVIRPGYRITERRVTLSLEEPRRTVRVALRDDSTSRATF